MKFAAPRTVSSAIASHDNGFNFVRLVCALMVVVYHSFQLNLVAPRQDPLTALLAPAADTGSVAVGVFFIISGLFVTQSWMSDPHPLRFIARRLARIVPGLFACMLLTTLVAVSYFSEQGMPGLATSAPWRYIFGNTALHLLQYNIPPEELFIPGVLGGFGLNGALWTLYWEGRMYVMVVLIGLTAVLPMRQWIRNAAIFLLLAANLFPAVLSGFVWEVPMWSLFLIGMLLQTVATRARIGPMHLLGAAALLLLNWTRNASLTPSPVTWFGVMLVAGALAMWVGTARTRGLEYFRLHDYSYGIYIWHWPVILMVRATWPQLDAIPLLLASLCVIIPAAVLSWHLVEAPAIRSVRKLLRARARNTVPS